MPREIQSRPAVTARRRAQPASCDQGHQQPTRGAARRRVARHRAHRRRADRSGRARTRGAAGGDRRRRPRRLARARRLPRARQRAGPHRVGGLRHRDARRRGRRRHHPRRHAAQLRRRSPPRAPRSTRKIARQRRASCIVDVGFWGGVVPGNAARAGRAGRGRASLGCKAFLVHSGIDEFPQRRPSAICARRCRCCASTGCRCSPTPSSTSGLDAARRRGRSARPTPAIWLAARAPGRTPRSRC